MSVLFLSTSIFIYLRKRCKASLILYDQRVHNFKEFYDYLLMCISSGIQNYGDYIGYELIILFGSFLNTESFIATVIALNYANVIGYIYVGFTYPLSHFVAAFLGTSDYKMYHHTIQIFYKIFFGLALVFGFITIFYSSEISGIYSRNTEVIALDSLFLKIWGIGLVFDIFNMMLQGILRGVGKQNLVSIWNIIVCFVWMIPSSFIFCFVLKLGIVGLYSGCFSVVVILCFINLYYYLN